MKPDPSKKKHASLSFEKKIIAYFILIVLVIMSIILIYRRVSERSRANRELVTHTEKILAQADTIQSLRKDLIINIRTFILSNDPQFLKAQDSINRDIDKAFQALQLLATPGDMLSKRLDTLRSLHARHIQLASSQTHHREFDQAEKNRYIQISEGLQNEIRRVFQTIRSEKEQLLKVQRADYRENMMRTSVILRILLLFFILLILFAFIVIYINSVRARRAKYALRKSEVLVRGIVDHAPVLINVKDKHGRYILTNQQFAIAVNSTPAALAGKRDIDVLPQDVAERINAEETEILTTKSASDIEISLPAADGTNSYITSMFPLVDDRGKIYAIGSTSVDITAIKRAHAALEQSYRQQQKILNGVQLAMSTSSDMLCIINERGEFVMVSDTSRELLGYAPKELQQKRFMDFVATEDKVKTERASLEIMAGNPVAEFNNHYIAKDGSKVPITWSGKWSEEDRMMYCIARNATNKIKTEQQLAKSMSRLAHAQKIAKLGNWDWDIKNDNWSCSDEFYDLLGLPRDSGNVQQLFLNSIHPDDKPMMEKMRNGSLQTGQGLETELRILRTDNKMRYMHTKVEVKLGPDKKPVSVSGTLQDVTQRKSEELKLKQLNEDLEKRAAELKDSNTELERFAYVASHDLQEPLRMVSSFLALLQKRMGTDLDDTSRKYIHFAVDGAERMKGLIKDLLLYSKLGSSSNLSEEVNLQEVMNDVLHVYEESIRENNAVINLVPLPVVRGNKVQLHQLLQNLVGNALKYRGKADPVISIGCREEKKEWVFSVSDNGIGIDPRFFSKIFIIFQRLHNKNDYSGTGIGLAICKKIIDRHEGRIWVESEPDKGSTFYFTLKKQAYAK